MILSAFVTFFAFYLVFHSLSPKWLRRLAGHPFAMNLITHGVVFYCFFGTSTDGFLQAEAAAIMFSLFFMSYRKLLGYERLHNFRWVRHAGKLTRYVA